MYLRTQTRKIKIGNITVGGSSKIIVQSMTKTDTRDIPSTIKQINKLEKLGCEIIRVSVPDIISVRNLKKIKKNISIPLVADIHFDYRIALEAIQQQVDKIRINPGNIKNENHLRTIVEACKSAKIPIRIGLNSGSLPQKNLPYNEIPEYMVKTAIKFIKMFESWNFFDTVISMKSTDVMSTVLSYEMLAKKVDYPLHLGITEAGPYPEGIIKSSVGLGILLYKGIGDTIRVSLTSSPEQEVIVAYQILNSLNLRNVSYEIISCPTCSRCKFNLIEIVQKLQKELQKYFSNKKIKKTIKIAVMGCVVNGPGEASHSDIGIAGGKNTGLLFIKGKPIKKVLPKNWIKEIMLYIKSMTEKY